MLWQPEGQHLPSEPPLNIVCVVLQTRPLYLHHYGGIYADLDIAAIRPADELLALMHKSSILIGQDCANADAETCGKNSQHLPNAFMASVRGHQFWMFVMHGILRGVWEKGIDSAVGEPNWTTGPAPLLWAYKKYVEHANSTDEITILEKQIYPYSWADHHGTYSLGCCFDNDNLSMNTSCCQTMFPSSYVMSFWTATWWA